MGNIPFAEPTQMVNPISGKCVEVTHTCENPNVFFPWNTAAEAAVNDIKKPACVSVVECGGALAAAGACSGTTLNGCMAGTFADLADTATTYEWQCVGTLTTELCSAAIPACGPYHQAGNPAEPSPAQACANGTAYSVLPTSGPPPHNWRCSSLDQYVDCTSTAVLTWQEDLAAAQCYSDGYLMAQDSVPSSVEGDTCFLPGAAAYWSDGGGPCVVGTTHARVFVCGGGSAPSETTINGTCGSFWLNHSTTGSPGAPVPNPSSTELCATGTLWSYDIPMPTWMVGEKRWYWTCNGSGGGSDQTCYAFDSTYPTIEGVAACGTDNGRKVSYVNDTTALPALGSTVNASCTTEINNGYTPQFNPSTNKYEWRCSHQSSATPFTLCATAPVTVVGQCGPGHHSGLHPPPDPDLCASGVAANRVNNGTYTTWECQGGLTAMCTSALPGTCGTAHKGVCNGGPTDADQKCIATNLPSIVSFDELNRYDWSCNSVDPRNGAPVACSCTGTGGGGNFAWGPLAFDTCNHSSGDCYEVWANQCQLDGVGAPSVECSAAIGNPSNPGPGIAVLTPRGVGSDVAGKCSPLDTCFYWERNIGPCVIRRGIRPPSCLLK